MKSGLNERLGAILILLAILLAVAGQGLLVKHPLIGLSLWLAAAVLMFFALKKTKVQPIPAITVNQVNPEKMTDWGSLTMVGAVALCCVSFYLFTTDLPNLPAWILHAVSLALALVSVTLFVKEGKKNLPAEKWQRLEIAAFVLVLLVGGFLRFFRLTQMPYGFWYDEADDGLNALQIFSNPRDIPVFASSTQLPAHLIYLIALAIKLFGQSIFSVRVVSALFGLGTVAAAFLFGRELFNRRTGILLAFLLAVSRWDLTWSHIGMHGVTVPFFELLTLGLLLRALRLQRWRDYLFAGLSLGLGLCFYVPFRLFPAIVAFFFVLVWITHPDFMKKHWRHLLVFLFGAVLISVPITQFAVTHPEDFWGRMGTVSIFSGRSFEEGLKTVLKTGGEHLAMFNFKGDRNGRHNIPGEPMLDLVSGGLMILGVIICLLRIKKPVSLLTLAWLLLMIVPGIFSLDFESPQSYRSIGSLPAASLLTALPLITLLHESETHAKQKSDILFGAFVGLTLLSIGGLNVYNYFVRQANSAASWLSHSTPDTIIAREMLRNDRQADYFVSTFYCHTPTVRFLAPEITEYHCVETHSTFPFLLDGERDALFFFDVERKPVYEQLKQIYPDAQFIEHKTPEGSIALYEVFLTRDDIRAVQGATARYFMETAEEGEPLKTDTLKHINADWSTSDPGTFPFNAEISTLLFADVFGEYRFTLEAPAQAALTLDGKPVVEGSGGALSASVELARGLHELEIKAEGAAGSLRLTWQPPEKEAGEIPSANLYLPPVTNNGLMGSYYPNAEWQGEPVLRQIDPFIHFYYHNPPLARPYTVEWSGRIRIDRPGTYEFGTESIDTSQLYLDGNLVIDNQTLNQYQGKQIELNEGMHEIKLRFADLTGHTHVNLYWQPPEGERETIPSEVLFLP